MRRHWPEYLMETAELGLFMLCAAAVTTVLEHPASPLRIAISSPVERRVLTGIAMGLTAAALIYSPWGKQSGAHFNPSVTLTYLRLGRIAPADAVCYIAAQFVGGVAGIALAALILGPLVANPAVRYASTLPGPAGPEVAFIAEVVISFFLMLMVLSVSNHERLGRFIGLMVAACVAAYITVEAPLSGMSMNPARTFGPALLEGTWRPLWIYFTAPPLGMLAAAEVFVRIRGRSAVRCAKLHHQNDRRCIFRCEYAAARPAHV